MDKFLRAIHKLHKGERGLTGLETAIILIAFVTVAAVFGYAVLSAGIFSTEKAKESIYQGMAEAKSTLVIAGDIIATENITGIAYDGTCCYPICADGYTYNVTARNCTSCSFNETAGTIGELRITVANNIGGEPIDLTPPQDNGLDGDGNALTCAWSCDGILDCDENGSGLTVISYTDVNQHIPALAWTICRIGADDGDVLLEKGEKMELVIPIGVALETVASGDTRTFTALGPNQKFSIEVKPPHGAIIGVEKWTPAEIETVMVLR